MRLRHGILIRVFLIKDVLIRVRLYGGVQRHFVYLSGYIVITRDLRQSLLHYCAILEKNLVFVKKDETAKVRPRHTRLDASLRPGTYLRYMHHL